MELRQLRYFLTVVEEANFTRAASRLHVAQPGVSAQVRLLERELGQDLLDRTGRTVKLTEAGAAVLPFARAALGAVDGARRAVDELTGLVRGHVAVGMVVSCGFVDVPDLLARFHARHPGVRITLTEANADVLVDGLRDGRLDLAFVAVGPEPPDGIEMEVVADDTVVVAVGPDDPLYDRRSVALTALRDTPLVSMPRGAALRSILDGACARAGFRPRIAFEASDPRMLLRFAARGLGAAVVTATMVREPGLRAVPVARPRLHGKVGVAWRADGPTSPAARAVIAHARRTVSGSGHSGEDGTQHD